MLVAEILLFFIFLVTDFAHASDCPSFCPKFAASAKCGKVDLTIFYDNDRKDSIAQPHTLAVQFACDALDKFKDKLSLEFKIGAKTREDQMTGELLCYADCNEDRWEACASMHMTKEAFAKFVCCKNRNGSVFGCAQKYGIEEATLQECYNQKKSDQILLNIAKERDELKILDCWLCIDEFRPKFICYNFIF